MPLQPANDPAYRVVLTLDDRGSQGLGGYLGESMATKESHYGK